MAGMELFDSDVLKVGHHGSRSSSSAEFLDRVSLSVTVVSAGEGNRFGHPHPETLEALLARVREDRLFVTSERGTVEFVTDGRRSRPNVKIEGLRQVLRAVVPLTGASGRY